MEKRITLYFKEGTSDKVYALQMIPDGSNYVVNFQYGRRGGNLKDGTKTPIPVSQKQAEKIYDKIVNEKLKEGYVEGQPGTETITPKKKGHLGILPQLLNPVEDAAIYINDDNYLAQEKFDGDRRMIASEVEIIGLNRKGESVLLPVPIVRSINKNFTIDGEIIGDMFYAFDILSLDGEDSTQLKCIERIALLNTNLQLGPNIKVVTTAFTTQEKQELYGELVSRRAEGIVFKKKNSVYTAGRPNSGGNQLKFKFYKTATFIVKDYTPGRRSVGLEVLDNGKRISVGRVTIPPNKNVPNIGDLIEVRYLYAYKGGSVYQPVYLGVRTDLDLQDADINQLVYKAGTEEDDDI